MVKEPKTKEFYEFGVFRLDVEKHRLWQGEELIPLTPKEFELLLTLVENAGRVIEKEELHEKIWKDTFVEDGTLTRNISWLRKKLAAGSEGGETFIETLPKRGYRFLAEVKKTSDGNALVIEEQTRTRIRVEETVSLSESPVVGSSLSFDDRRPVHQLQPPVTAGRSDRKLWVALAFGITACAAIAFAFYQNYFRQPEARVVSVSRVRPFSGLAGRESLPAFSPDGKQVAFVWNGGEGEILDVYVRLVAEGEAVRLTKGEVNSLFPAYTPDGRYVAFSRSFPDTSRIYLVPALGGAERKIAEVRSGGTSFSFSPDGKTLVVADRDPVGSASGLFLVNVETGAKQRLTTPPEKVNEHDPRFSPKGQTIAFVRSDNPNTSDLFLVSVLPDQSPRQLTFDKAQIKGLAWSADGERIIFSSKRGPASTSNLWQIRAAGGEPVPVMTGGKNPISPAVSPDSKTIAYVEEFEDTNIWQLSKVENPATAPGYNFKKFIASARGDHSQQFSPDGSKFVFASERTGEAEIWLANADGSNLLAIPASTRGGSPRFSPDGTSIAFGITINGKGQIFVVSADAGKPRLLSNSSASDHLPAWSSDGRWIYFTSDRSGDLQIWKTSTSGGEARQITRHGAFEMFEAPDGKTLFYSKGRGVAGLWRVGTEGGEETTVAELAEAGYWRSWTVTQKGLYYVGRAASPPYQIRFYDFSDGQTRVLATTDKAPLWNFSGLSATADGRVILYAQFDQNASSIVLADPEK